MHRLALSILAASVCGAASARAEVFRYKLRPGQVITNQMSMAGATLTGQTAGQMSRMQFRSANRQQERVRSVDGGAITLELTDLPGTMTTSAEGQTQTVKRGVSKSLVRMTERGRFLSRKALSASEDDDPGDLEGLDALFGLNFPERDLKPGDTWEDTFTIGQGLRARKAHVTWKYVGRAAFRGRACAKVTATLTAARNPAENGGAGAPPSEGRLTGSVTTYFDPRAGMEIYSSGSLVIVAKVDLSGLSPEAGEVATVSKINVVQSLVEGR